MAAAGVLLYRFSVCLRPVKRNYLNVSFQRAFYRKRRDKYKDSKTKSVNIEGILRKPNLTSHSGEGLMEAKSEGQHSKQDSNANNDSTANGKSSLAKETQESWQHSTQRLNSLRTAEKR